AVENGGYKIGLYYSELGSDSTFAAGFFAFLKPAWKFRELGNTSPVVLRNGIDGVLRPVSWGGSCAPANLWWEQNGVIYQIQIKLRSTMSEEQQEKIL